ncbi:MAG: FAD-dependent oxidoreductase [Alphaproteobacteria bacterium]
MRSKKSRYHIIGGGIAGLCCAKFIREKNPSAEIILYEAANHCGGRCCSFYDKHLDTDIDNATHVILGANKNILKLLQKKKFHSDIKFWDEGKLLQAHHGIKEAVLAMCNTPFEQTSRAILQTIFFRLFPFLPYKLKAAFSENNLSQTLIAPLVSYPDTINYGYKLLSFHEKDGRICRLDFNKGSVELTVDDQIISALDAAAYCRIFKTPEFDFNPIINIHYRTSMPITLPRNLKLLGLKNCTAQWLFVHDKILSVTISNAADISLKDEDLALKVWREICVVRQREAAFLPAYRVLRHKKATICQNEKNNSLRPCSAATCYSNLFIAGDWTMKNWPACLEAAVLSAKRAVSLL